MASKKLPPHQTAPTPSSRLDSIRETLALVDRNLERHAENRANAAGFEELAEEITERIDDLAEHVKRQPMASAPVIQIIEKPDTDPPRSKGNSRRGVAIAALVAAGSVAGAITQLVEYLSQH